jgi:hypothetical protein
MSLSGSLDRDDLGTLRETTRLRSYGKVHLPLLELTRQR